MPVSTGTASNYRVLGSKEADTLYIQVWKPGSCVECPGGWFFVNLRNWRVRSLKYSPTSYEANPKNKRLFHYMCADFDLYWPQREGTSALRYTNRNSVPLPAYLSEIEYFNQNYLGLQSIQVNLSEVVCNLVRLGPTVHSCSCIFLTRIKGQKFLHL